MEPDDLISARGGKPIYTPPPAAQGLPGPSREIYAAMGEQAIFDMLRDFYRELGQSAIRELFPEDLDEASKKSARFFVGLMGGPPLYHQQHGNPRMRARHLPFVIDDAAREVWLACFNRVLEGSDQKYGFPPEHLDGFKTFLEGFSAWMVNAR